MGVKRDSSGNRREGSARIRGTVLHVPIIHGSHAQSLGKKASETKSHRWVLYLRPKDNVDISHFIKEVEFCLHDSFSPKNRSMFTSYLLEKDACPEVCLLTVLVVVVVWNDVIFLVVRSVRDALRINRIRLGRI